MTLLHGDGFDHYGSTAELTQNYYSAATLSNANPRTGPYSMHVGFGVTWTWPGALLRGGFGFAQSLQAFDDNRIYWGTGGGDDFLSFQFVADGSIKIFKNGFGATLIGQTAAALIQLNSYQYLEMSYFKNVAGYLEIRLNNVQIFLLQNYDFSTLATPSTLKWYYAGQAYIDDLVLWDTNGAVNNNFLGDVRCRTSFAISNGPDQDWAVTGAVPAYQAVSQVPSDPATKYIASAVIGDHSNFNMTQLPTNTAYAAAVVVVPQASKTDAGVCAIDVSITVNANTTATQTLNPATGTGRFPKIFENDPLGNPWLLPALQAIQPNVVRSA